MLAFLQGGGVVVGNGGVANFDNCEISENEADGYVRILKFEPFLHLLSSVPLERYTMALVLSG